MLSWAVLNAAFPVVAAEISPLPPESSQRETSEPLFTIRNFRVDGNTLLPVADVETLLNAFVGEGRRFADVEASRQALAAQYLERGYSTVRVILPEQEISSGTIQLLVQEMKLGRVEIIASPYHDAENVRRSVPDLIEGSVPNTVHVAESLRLANENPSKQTQLLLKPDPAGARVDALLRLEDEKPWKVFMSLDNTGTVETGRLRYGVGFQHANLFNRDHVATVQYITSPEQLSNVSIFGVGYRIPLYNPGDALDFYGGYSDVNSGVVGGLFNVSGKGTIFGGRYTHALIKTSAFEHKFAAGLDYRAYQNDITAGGLPLGHNVTVRPVNLTWSSLWKDERSLANGYLTWIANLPGGAHGGDSDFVAARAGAQADYQVFRLGGNVNHRLAGDWQLRLALDAQYSRDPLVPGEQFGLGGQDSVRGFNERSVSGDRGARYGIELFTPDMGALAGIADSRLRFSGFLEGGQTQRVNAQAGEIVNESLASIGLGMRFGLGKTLSVRFDWGHVIDGSSTVARGHDRLHGSVAYVF